MTKKKISETFVKFALPVDLKEFLQQIAEARGISLSAFVRLVLSDYIKHKS